MSDELVGAAFFPSNAPPLRVRTVILRHDDDTDEIVIGAAEDGRWFKLDCGVQVYPTPQALAGELWNNGDPGRLYLELLHELGWLCTNPAAIGEAARRAFLVEPVPAKPDAEGQG